MVLIGSNAKEEREEMELLGEMGIVEREEIYRAEGEDAWGLQLKNKQYLTPQYSRRT